MGVFIRYHSRGFVVLRRAVGMEEACVQGFAIFRGVAQMPASAVEYAEKARTLNAARTHFSAADRSMGYFFKMRGKSQGGWSW